MSASALAEEGGVTSLDLESIRKRFPALQQQARGKDLVYLDSAATALKPQSVIDAVVEIYARDCGNVHRAVHQLSQRATQSLNAAREKIQNFLGASAPQEVIFTSGTTDSINLVSQAWARPRLGPGDQILITGLEHHSNIVPWQMVCEQTGAELIVARIDDDGDVPLDAFRALLSERVRLVACAHASNALGTVLPVREIAGLAHQVGAVVVVDGAQSAPHLPVDVTELGCDFYALSGHKLYGPTGIGVLWGRREILEETGPWRGGGDMIRTVTFEKTTYADLPARLEAGTPHIAGAVGLGAAVDFVESLGREAIHQAEKRLLAYGTEVLSAIPGLTLIGTANSKIGVLSFTLDGVHPHDIGTIVDMEGVAIRTGHHCAQPVMDHFKIPATARASLGVYNSREDIDALARAITSAQELFS